MRKCVKTMASVAVALVSILAFGTSAWAAPEKMPDGEMFDAAYYAENNPDVTAAVGDSVSALYSHYEKYGKKEGRKAYVGDSGETGSVGLRKSSITFNTSTDINSSVARGECLVDLFGVATKSGVTNSGIYWESSWYVPYTACWTNLYEAFCGDKYTISDFQNGEILSELIRGNIGKGGAEMLLDFGLYTDYVDDLKRRGTISQEYQLPKTFYSINKTGKTFTDGYFKGYYITTDCPEAEEYYYYSNNPDTRFQNQKLIYKNYTPKYIRDGASLK